jgi:hypothetical protein
MNNTDPYECWLEHKRAIPSSPELVDDVMHRVRAFDAAQHASTARQAPSRFQRLLEWISLRPFAQAVVIATGALIGALRLFATFQFILSY